MRKILLTTIITLFLVKFSTSQTYMNYMKIGSLVKKTNVSFTIYGWGNYTQSDLIKTQNLLMEVFGFESEISGEYISWKIDRLPNNSYPLKKLYFLNNSGYNIFVTRDKISDEGSNVQGDRRGNNIIITDLNLRNTTFVHEFSHFLGLKHCSDSECLMYFKETNSSDFCNKCVNFLYN